MNRDFQFFGRLAGVLGLTLLRFVVVLVEGVLVGLGHRVGGIKHFSYSGGRAIGLICWRCDWVGCQCNLDGRLPLAVGIQGR